MVILRAANSNDISLLEYWDTLPHVQQGIPEDDDWQWSKELFRAPPPWREMLIAEVDSIPIGFIQIIDPFEEETHYWEEVEPNKRALDIWIGNIDYLNKGYGTQMMQLAIEKCFKIPEVTGILIDPLSTNVKAHRFYERLGFEFIEERVFLGDLCFVYELKRP